MTTIGTQMSPQAAVEAAMQMKTANTREEAAILTFKKSLDAAKQNAAAMIKLVSGNVGRNINTYG